MWLVTSPKGGVHYHALIVLKPNSRKYTLKGIHINIQNLNDRERNRLMRDWSEFKQDQIDDATEVANLVLQHTGDKALADTAYDKTIAPPSKVYQKKQRERSFHKKYKHIVSQSRSGRVCRGIVTLLLSLYPMGIMARFFIFLYILIKIPNYRNNMFILFMKRSFTLFF